MPLRPFSPYRGRGLRLGGDADRVESGTERYLLDIDGQTVFS